MTPTSTSIVSVAPSTQNCELFYGEFFFASKPQQDDAPKTKTIRKKKKFLASKKGDTTFCVMTFSLKILGITLHAYDHCHFNSLLQYSALC